MRMLDEVSGVSESMTKAIMTIHFRRPMDTVRDQTKRALKRYGFAEIRLEEPENQKGMWKWHLTPKGREIANRVLVSNGEG